MAQEQPIDKIIEIIKPKLKESDLSIDHIEFDKSMIVQGFLDSISFLELIVALESYYNIQIDFDDLDPSEFTSIKNLDRLIRSKITAHKNKYEEI